MLVQRLPKFHQKFSFVFASEKSEELEKQQQKNTVEKKNPRQLNKQIQTVRQTVRQTDINKIIVGRFLVLAKEV